MTKVMFWTCHHSSERMGITWQWVCHRMTAAMRRITSTFVAHWTPCTVFFAHHCHQPVKWNRTRSQRFVLFQRKNSSGWVTQRFLIVQFPAEWTCRWFYLCTFTEHWKTQRTTKIRFCHWNSDVDLRQGWKVSRDGQKRNHQDNIQVWTWAITGCDFCNLSKKKKKCWQLMFYPSSSERDLFCWQGSPVLEEITKDCEYIFSWSTNVICAEGEPQKSTDCKFTDPRTLNVYDLSPLKASGAHKVLFILVCQTNAQASFWFSVSPVCCCLSLMLFVQTCRWSLPRMVLRILWIRVRQWRLQRSRHKSVKTPPFAKWRISKRQVLVKLTTKHLSWKESVSKLATGTVLPAQQAVSTSQFVVLCKTAFRASWKCDVPSRVQNQE